MLGSIQCLRFWLRNREDMERLADGFGSSLSPAATEEDQQKLSRVCELADEQAGEVLGGWLERVAHALANARVRIVGTTRRSTAARHWDAWVRLRAAGSRADDAYVGVNLGFASPQGGRVHLYFGHAAKRFVLGPALYETLRRAGVSAQLADGRSGFADWARGTVILGSYAFDDGDEPAAISDRLAKSVEQSLVAHWELVRNLMR